VGRSAEKDEMPERQNCRKRRLKLLFFVL
jgi:hypothetical protein